MTFNIQLLVVSSDTKAGFQKIIHSCFSSQVAANDVCICQSESTVSSLFRRQEQAHLKWTCISVLWVIGV